MRKCCILSFCEVLVPLERLLAFYLTRVSTKDQKPLQQWHQNFPERQTGNILSRSSVFIKQLWVFTNFRVYLFFYQWEFSVRFSIQTLIFHIGYLWCVKIFMVKVLTQFELSQQLQVSKTVFSSPILHQHIKVPFTEKTD